VDFRVSGAVITPIESERVDMKRVTQSTLALMKKHGFTPVFVESEGGHTWLNWRDYLSEFAPQLSR
jgi:enterochelin esterase-like enzyme